MTIEIKIVLEKGETLYSALKALELAPPLVISNPDAREGEHSPETEIPGIDRRPNSYWREAQQTAEPEKGEDARDQVIELDELKARMSADAAIDTSAAKPPAAREPGKPAPGHRRRTNAEIAEDEAYFASHHEEKARQEDSTIAEVQAISTGEERVDPEIAAQDAADEAAETAATKKELTHDDLRHAVGQYAKVHGLIDAQANIPLILGCPIIAVPKTQEALADAIRKVEVATHAPNVLVDTGTTIAPVKKEESVLASRDDVIAAFKSYAKKYDGQCDDLSKAPNVLVDGPVILAAVFGANTTQIAQIPNTPESWGKALTAINDAINSNPFSRKAQA